MSNNGWIGVDLDGTLAHYSGWQGELVIGDPVTAMVARVRKWLAEGKEVRIFTARVWDDGGKRDVELVKAAIYAWSAEHIGHVLEVTNIKDFHMVELWDDRAIQVMPNTGLTYQDMLSPVGSA